MSSVKLPMIEERRRPLRRGWWVSAAFAVFIVLFVFVGIYLLLSPVIESSHWPKFIVDTLRSVNGNRIQAAKILGLHRSSLYEKMRQHGVSE